MDNIRDTIGLSGPARDAKLVKLIVIVISALLIFMIAGWIYSKLTLKEKKREASTGVEPATVRLKVGCSDQLS